MAVLLDPNVLELIASQLKEANVFDSVEVVEHGVNAAAPGEEVDATYYLAIEEDEVFAGMQTPDRWLSGSIEGDLVHTGDKLDDLLADELYELGVTKTLAMEHFRDEKKSFVFRSRIGQLIEEAGDGAGELIATILLAYQAMFIQLGDMDGEGED